PAVGPAGSPRRRLVAVEQLIPLARPDLAPGQWRRGDRGGGRCPALARGPLGGRSVLRPHGPAPAADQGGGARPSAGRPVAGGALGAARGGARGGRAPAGPARPAPGGLAGPDVDARGVAHVRAHALALASARRLRCGADPSAPARCRAPGVLRGGAPILVAGDRPRPPSAATGPPRGADRLPGPRDLPGGDARTHLDGRPLGSLPI